MELARHAATDHTVKNASPIFSAEAFTQSVGKGFSDLALIPLVASTAARDSMNLRDDALALRADAMSLRADAMILQSGAALASSGSSGPHRRVAALRSFRPSIAHRNFSCCDVSHCFKLGALFYQHAIAAKRS